MSDLVKIQDVRNEFAVETTEREVPLRIQKRRHRASDMRLKGKTLREIAAVLDVSPTTVSNDLDWVKEQWMRTSVSKIEEFRASQLAQIQLIMRESWDAWEGSKNNKVTKTVITRGKGDKKYEEVSETTEYVSTGDQNHIKTITWGVTELNKMMGLHAPKKHQIIDKKLDVNRLMDQLNPTQLARVANGEDPILVILDDYQSQKKLASPLQEEIFEGEFNESDADPNTSES